MKLNYINNLDDGSLEIKPISFWKALLLSFLFDMIYSLISIPKDIFLGVFPFSVVSEGIINTVTEFIYQYGTILIIIIIINRSFRRDKEPLYQVADSKEKYMAGIGMIIGYILFTYGVFDMLLYSLPTLNEGLYEYLEEYLSNTSYILVFISTCIIAPIFEEILYRGVLFNGLLKKYSYKKAIVFSAAIFGIAHMNLPQGVNAFCLGIIIATVYYYTRSLYVCMAMHFSNNLLVNFVFYPQSKIWTMVLFIVIPIIGAAVFVKSYKAVKEDEGIKYGQEDY